MELAGISPILASMATNDTPDTIARASALDQMGCYLRSGRGRGLAGPAFSAADRHIHSRIFELCATHELGHTLWERLPPEAFERGGVAITRLGRRTDKPRDTGIDAATADWRFVS